MSASDAQAEDAVQQALIRGWRHRGACREPQHYLAWLAQIARREALRLHAQEGRYEQWDEERSRGTGEAPFEAVLARLELRDLLAELDPEERSLLYLRYGADLTYPELAQRLGIPIGTAKVRIHRLRARLRARVTEQL